VIVCWWCTYNAKRIRREPYASCVFDSAERTLEREYMQRPCTANAQLVVVCRSDTITVASAVSVNAVLLHGTKSNARMCEGHYKQQATVTQQATYIAIATRLLLLQ
jgi:hypothetical protein